MQELFIETKDVFTLKQLETTCSKQKGIVSQTVKDILDGLCSDNMVSSDKIGTSNYFWLFPSQSIVVRKNQIEDLKKQLESSKKRKIELNANIEKASKGREVTDDRKEKLKTLAELETKNAELQQELTLFADNDPERVEQMSKYILSHIPSYSSLRASASSPIHLIFQLLERRWLWKQEIDGQTTFGVQRVGVKRQVGIRAIGIEDSKSLRTLTT
jgi:cell division protein FtsB